MADQPFDVNQLIGSMAKFNPVTAIPGMIQQGQQAIDPAMQQIMQLYQKLFGPQLPQGPTMPAPPQGGLKQRMTGGGGGY